MCIFFIFFNNYILYTMKKCIPYILYLMGEDKMAWTDDRVEILTKLWGEGLSASQIARELGDVTRNAVIGKVHRLGLAGRASPTRPKSRIRHASSICPHDF